MIKTTTAPSLKHVSRMQTKAWLILSWFLCQGVETRLHGVEANTPEQSEGNLCYVYLVSSDSDTINSNIPKHCCKLKQCDAKNFITLLKEKVIKMAKSITEQDAILTNAYNEQAKYNQDTMSRQCSIADNHQIQWSEHEENLTSDLSAVVMLFGSLMDVIKHKARRSARYKNEAENKAVLQRQSLHDNDWIAFKEKQKIFLQHCANQSMDQSDLEAIKTCYIDGGICPPQDEILSFLQKLFPDKQTDVTFSDPSWDSIHEPKSKRFKTDHEEESKGGDH